jgi:predicted TIM-barrel fold metal-dependent hydrolase
MREAGVALSVTLPVLTSPAQFESVTRFAAELNRLYEKKSPRLLSFGGIHPDCEDIEGKMAYLRDNGFKGVKIHPDYQGVYIDDERYIRIVAAAKKEDLIVVTHAGVDTGFRGCPVRCTPDRALNLIRSVPYRNLVFAHLGGCEMQDEVLETLAGEDVYLDTAYVLRFTDKEYMKKLLLRHGEDRILFASDSPWSDIKTDVDILKGFSLGEKTEEKIFCENAKALLGIR